MSKLQTRSDESESETEEEKLKRRFSLVDAQELCGQFQEQGLKISDLTMTKYMNLFQQNTKNLVPVLPRIQIPLQVKDKKEVLQDGRTSQFLTQQDIVYLKRSIINHVGENNSTLFRNKSQHDFSKSQENISPIYHPKQVIKFQLSHNKGQLQQNLNYQQRFIDQLLEKNKLIKRLSPGRKDYHVFLFQIKQIRTYAKKIEESAVEVNTQESRGMTTREDNYQFNVFWVEREQHKWKPPAREGHTLTAINKKYYLYGGIGNVKHLDMLQFDTQKWNQVKAVGDTPILGRNNHTGAAYKRIIYFVGGEKYYDQTQKQLSDIRTFNTENMEWKRVQLAGDSMEVSRAHQACFVGKNMVIFGGMNTKGKYLQEVYVLDIAQMKLSKQQAYTKPLFEYGIAFHTMTAVYTASKYPALFKPIVDNEKCEKKRNTFIKNEGLYVFGGEDQGGIQYKGLYMIDASQNPFYVIQLETKGRMPQSRTRHVAAFHEGLNIYIIQGGINKDYYFLNDINILKLDSLMWVTVKESGFIGEPRAGHQAAFDEKRLMLFGGYNQEGFVRGDIQWIEFDSKMALKMIQPNIQAPVAVDVAVNSSEPNLVISNMNNLNNIFSTPDKLNIKLSFSKKKKLGIQTKLSQMELTKINLFKQETQLFDQFDESRQKTQYNLSPAKLTKGLSTRYQFERQINQMHEKTRRSSQ